MATTTFTPTDVQRRYREILDLARADGSARIRDTDGTTLILAPAANVEFHQGLARHLVDYSRFQAAYAAHAGTPATTWAAGTPYPFVAALNVDEVTEFLRELIATLLSAAETQTLEAHEGNLAAWRSTAEIVADPAVLAAALAPIDHGSVVALSEPPVA